MLNGRILPIMRKEFIQIRRDPRTLVIMLMVPALQMFLLGYAVTTNVDRIATVVYDQAMDSRSRGFVDGFTNTEYFTLVGHASSQREARQAIDRGEAKVALLIPPDFSKNLDAGKPAQVQMVVDGSDPTTASTALFTATAITQAKAANELQAVMSRVGLSRGVEIPIEIRPDILYNPSMQSVNFMIPALIGLIIQIQAVILTAFAIVREREKGTLEQLIVTPIKPWELMVGKILPYVLISFGQVAVALLVGTLWFQVPIAGSILLLLVLSVVFLVGSLGIGLFLSTVSKTQSQALQMAMLLVVPSFVLSGFVFPREAMPAILYYLGYFIPLTYFLKILRGIFLKGIGLEYLWFEVLLLAIFGLAVFGMSAKRFQKKLE
ncbi:MAG: ABC transporter permease [Bacteroidetes bacterium]|nr:ABC transporter permease [Bacteroidota bacterium]